VTVRAVIAAVLAAAIVAAALPAIDTGRERATDQQVRGELDAVERSAAALLATEETVRNRANAPQRSVTVTVPGRSWRRAGVDHLTLRAPDGDSAARAIYAVDGRAPRTRPLTAAVRPVDGPIELRESGEHRLRLRLVREDGERAVLVDRPGR
jgi:type II secretory pathway pseudopilin PulG